MKNSTTVLDSAMLFQRFEAIPHIVFRLLIGGIPLLPLVHSPQAAFAQNQDTHSGQIRLYHLNGDISVRGACVQMYPPIVIDNDWETEWACVYRDNHLYDEINEMLMSALLGVSVSGGGDFPVSSSASVTCDIRYEARNNSDGDKIQPAIIVAECYRFRLEDL